MGAASAIVRWGIAANAGLKTEPVVMTCGGMTMVPRASMLTRALANSNAMLVREKEK
jgi:hypothetical protein